jgi:UDP-2,3-diacylglucosamine pyrophosphatase LpxH
MVRTMKDNDWTLVVGDAHVDPSQLRNNGLRRFQWLHDMIVDKKPNRVVIIGDFSSMQSLSAWDKDKRRLVEGRRLAKDWEAANIALDYIEDATRRADCWQNVIFIAGNHEEWVTRYVDIHPENEGLDAYDIEKALYLDKRNWKYVPYKEDYKHRGVSFTHVPIQSNGKPVGGKQATARALEVYSNSVVFGHTHNFDVAAVHRKNSPSLQQAINCGCFFEHVDEYAKGSMTNYWRGILMLNHYDTNRVDIEQWSLGRMRRVYG